MTKILRYVSVCMAMLISLAGTVVSQRITLHSIDASNFPTMKATISVIDEFGLHIEPNTNDLVLRDNGIPQQLTSITCKRTTSRVPVSAVLTLDVSKSMDSIIAGGTTRFQAAKAAAREWVNNMSAGSECAITAFCGSSRLACNFTEVKPPLLNAINMLQLCNGTNYAEGFLDFWSGGLVVSRNAKYKKILLFMTDGNSTTFTPVTDILNEALRQECVIYSVVVGMPCPAELRQISEQTGGIVFEQVRNSQALVEAFLAIQDASTKVTECEVTWQSNLQCAPAEHGVEVQWHVARDQQAYMAPGATAASPRILPADITFNAAATTTQQKEILLVGGEQDIHIDNINTGNPDFTIVPSGPFDLAARERKSFVLTYVPSSVRSQTTEITFVSNLCPAYARINVSYERSLELTHPNGGEVFLVSSDTVVTWEGVSATRPVVLKFSSDAGRSWSLVDSIATGLTRPWHVPNNTSNTCLMKVEKYAYGDAMSWAQYTGGSSLDMFNSIAYSNGFVYSAGRTSSATLYDGDSLTAIRSTTMDAILVKRNSSGKIAWIRKVVGDGDESYISVSTDAAGNVYALGTTTSSRITAATQSVNVRIDVPMTFVIKYSSTGIPQWMETIPGTTGFVSALNNGVAAVVNANDTSGNYRIIRFNANGTVISTRLAADNPPVQVTGIALDQANDLYISGNVITANASTAIVRKSGLEGTPQWTQSIGNAIGNATTGICVGIAGDAKILVSYPYPQPSSRIVTYSTNGAAGSMSVVATGAEATSITSDKDGNLYTSLLIADRAQVGRDTVLGRGGRDIVVTRTDFATGTTQLVAHLGGIGDDVAKGIAFAEDSPIVTGYFTDTADYVGTQLRSKGSTDGFVWSAGHAPEEIDVSDSLWAIVDLMASVRARHVRANIGDHAFLVVDAQCPQQLFAEGITAITTTLRVSKKLVAITSPDVSYTTTGDSLDIFVTIPRDSFNGKAVYIPVYALLSSDSLSPVRVLNSKALGIPARIEEFPGSITVEGICYVRAMRSIISSLGSIEVALAPTFITGNNAMLDITTSIDASMNVGVVDLTGRTIAELHSGYVDKGEHTYPVESTGLPTGSYMLSVNVAGNTTFIPFYVVN